jgi:hypothetical protein
MRHVAAASPLAPLSTRLQRARDQQQHDPHDQQQHGHRVAAFPGRHVTWCASSVCFLSTAACVPASGRPAARHAFSLEQRNLSNELTCSRRI